MINEISSEIIIIIFKQVMVILSVTKDVSVHKVAKYDPDDSSEVAHIKYDQYEFECLKEIFYVH